MCSPRVVPLSGLRPSIRPKGGSAKLGTEGVFGQACDRRGGLAKLGAEGVFGQAPCRGVSCVFLLGASFILMLGFFLLFQGQGDAKSLSGSRRCST